MQRLARPSRQSEWSQVPEPQVQKGVSVYVSVGRGLDLRSRLFQGTIVYYLWIALAMQERECFPKFLGIAMRFGVLIQWRLMTLR